MALYLYDSEHYEHLKTERETVSKCRSITAFGVNAKSIRKGTRILLNHDLLVVPSELQFNSANVERLKTIAHVLGIEVRVAIVHVSKEQHRKTAIGTAAAGAASPNQLVAAVALTH